MLGCVSVCACVRLSRNHFLRCLLSHSRLLQLFTWKRLGHQVVIMIQCRVETCSNGQNRLWFQCDQQAFITSLYKKTFLLLSCSSAFDLSIFYHHTLFFISIKFSHWKHTIRSVYGTCYSVSYTDLTKLCQEPHSDRKEKANAQFNKVKVICILPS